MPVFEQGPLDEAIRDGVWVPELQVKMPTMGGLPGSRGKRIEWPHGTAARPYSDKEKYRCIDNKPESKCQAKQGKGGHVPNGKGVTDPEP